MCVGGWAEGGREVEQSCMCYTCGEGVLQLAGINSHLLSCTGFWGHTQFIRLGDKCLYLWCHLLFIASPSCPGHSPQLFSCRAEQLCLWGCFLCRCLCLCPPSLCHPCSVTSIAASMLLQLSTLPAALGLWATHCHRCLLYVPIRSHSINDVTRSGQEGLGPQFSW